MTFSEKIRSLFTAQDMTIGAPWKRIAEFAWPMLIGNIAQQLYNTVDTIVVGKYVGDEALSAVGSAAPILYLLLALFVGVSAGASIVISQHFGAQRKEELACAIGNCLTLALIASVITTVLGYAVTVPFLRLLKTPDTIIDWCADYLHIFFLGAIGFTFYNIASGILRGLGDSLSALAFLLFSTALNIVLDIWFVAGFGLGVAGVSLATIIAQAISAVLCMIKLLRMKRVFVLRKEHFRLRKDSAGMIIKVGVPSGANQAVMSLSMLVVQALVNQMGTDVVACSVLVQRVDGFVMLPSMTFGMTMSVYSGQNVGACLPDRIRKGMKQGMIMALGLSVVVCAAILLLGRYLFAIFSDTVSLQILAQKMMQILAVGYIAVAAQQVWGGVIRGAGDTMTPMWLSVITTFTIRVPVAYLIAYLTRCEEYPMGRPEALFVSLLSHWLVGTLLMYLAYRFGKWNRVIRAMEEKTPETPDK